MAHRDPFAPRADRDRRLPRRRLAREARIRQVVREIRRLLQAKRDARADPLRRPAEYRDHSRNRPAGPQPQHRVGASRNPLQLSARHRVNQRLRLPFGMVRGPGGELRAAGRHSGRTVRAVPLGVHPRGRRRGRHVAVGAVSRLPGADETGGDDRPAPAGGPLHGAHGRNPPFARQTARRVERGRAHGSLRPGVPRARLGERQGLPRRHGEGLPHRRDAGPVLLFRHAPVAP